MVKRNNERSVERCKRDERQTAAATPTAVNQSAVQEGAREKRTDWGYNNKSAPGGQDALSVYERFRKGRGRKGLTGATTTTQLQAVQMLFRSTKGICVAAESAVLGPFLLYTAQQVHSYQPENATRSHAKGVPEIRQSLGPPSND